MMLKITLLTLLTLLSYPSRLSNRETLVLIQSNLQNPFMENNFVESAVHAGLSETEATSLFKQLVEQGGIGLDPEGYWRWT